MPARQVAQRAERRARPLPAGAGGCGVELLVHRGDGAVERRPTLLDRRRGGGSLLAEALPWVRAAKVDGRPAREQVELGVVGEPGEPGAGVQLVRQQPGGGHDRRVAVVVQAHTEDDRIGREGKPEALEEGDLGGRVVTRHAAVQHLGRRAALRGERALEENGERIGLLEALAEDDRVAEHEEPAVVGCGPRRRLAAAEAEAVHADLGPLQVARHRGTESIRQVGPIRRQVELVGDPIQPVDEAELPDEELAARDEDREAREEAEDEPTVSQLPRPVGRPCKRECPSRGASRAWGPPRRRAPR